MIIGQEKGKDTESRLFRNFGMPHPGRLSESASMHGIGREIQSARRHL